MPDAAGFHIEPPRPTIAIDPGEPHVAATAAEAAIIAAGRPVYQRGRDLVRPATQALPATGGRTTIAAVLSELKAVALQDELAQSAVFTRYNARSRAPKTIDPPRDVADTILSRFGSWSFPVVAGIITCPTLRPDNSVLAEPGYDAQTRLYLAADPGLVLPAIPAFPTRADAEAALAILIELLPSFPFVSDTDRSVALPALLTPVCRGAMTVAPLHVFTASTPGTGKSYLADLTSAIVAGRPCPAASAGVKLAETESRLNGLLLDGFPLISLDNITGELRSDLLCQAVERPLLRLRRLGESAISEVESRSTILATGNNLQVAADLTRRTLVCEMDTGLERPETWTFPFRPVDRVLADRGKYVAAALTVVRGYTVSGAPPPPSFASVPSLKFAVAAIRARLR